MNALCLLLISVLPRDDLTRDRVDLIEVNHFYDESGRPVFDQIIFWEWSSVSGEHHVRAWRLWVSPQHTPRRDWRNGGYVLAWTDGERLRVVRAPAFRETWTQHDPELDNRQRFSVTERRGLSGERPAAHTNLSAPPQ